MSSPAQRVELPAYAIVDLACEVEMLRAAPGRPGRFRGTAGQRTCSTRQYDQVVGLRRAGQRCIWGGQVPFLTRRLAAEGRGFDL